jgi:hypothetical protein
MANEAQLERESEEERELPLDPEAAPERVGVYERPERQGWSSATLVGIMAALTLIALVAIAFIVFF